MSILHCDPATVNPWPAAGELVEDDGRPAPPLPTLETSEWIEAQALYYRSQGSDLADVVAEVLEDLARDWRVASCGRPISVETFRARMDLIEEFQSELA